MGVLLFIVLLFGQQGWTTEVVPPTDWKLQNLKGAVQRMIVFRTTADGAKEKDVINFKEKGFVMIKTYYDSTSKTYTSFEEGEMEEIYTFTYTDYVDGVRYVYLYDNNRKWEDRDHAIETWDKVDDFLISTRNNNREKWEIECKYKEYKLMERWERESINYQKYSAEIERTSTFEYNKQGDLVKEIIHEEINGIEKDYTLIYDIRSRDAIGNILLQTKRNRETGDVITEQFDYLYYK
ncbi:MAG: hypothetical protein LBE34_14685 [Flavobacteriaceae bacterium]|jgi:hypothetical protein|nr:hypothetical protein [Flavobacteriaceae bacterium]